MLNTLLAGLFAPLFTIGSFVSIPILPAAAPPPVPQYGATQMYRSTMTGTSSTSTPGTVVVTTDENGRTTTQTVHAPYGVKSEVVSSYVNGKGTSYATTTALTQADVQQMQAQQQAMDAQMQQMFQDQEKMMQDVWSNF